MDTPQQNGIAEGKNRDLMEVTRSLMLTTNVPNHFWGEAVLSVAYLINRMPSKALHIKTPYQTLSSIYPNTRLLSSIPPKIFGCTAFVHDHQPNKGKLEPKSLKCIFLGYSPNKKGYKCYSSITKNFYHSMDVTFFENQPYYHKVGIQGERKENTVESQPWEMEENFMETQQHFTQQQILEPVNDLVTGETAKPVAISEAKPKVAAEPTVQGRKELQVFSRKKKTRKGEEICTFSRLHQNSDLQI